ncbi:MAG: clan AA aspartic protease [Bacteroidales bacterium]|nr:clan AA aspartic protease [Bacteroidales bacterium]
MEVIIPIEIVQLEDEHNLHPIVDAKLNGEPIRLVVDTGASHTCIDRKNVKSLIKKNPEDVTNDVVMGIGSRSMKNTILTIKEISIGDLIINDYPVVALKITHINKALKLLGLHAINGLLGSDILFKYNAIIDYKNRCLTFNI